MARELQGKFIEEPCEDVEDVEPTEDAELLRKRIVALQQESVAMAERIIVLESQLSILVQIMRRTIFNNHDAEFNRTVSALRQKHPKELSVLGICNFSVLCCVINKGASFLGVPMGFPRGCISVYRGFICDYRGGFRCADGDGNRAIWQVMGASAVRCGPRCRNVLKLGHASQVV